MVFRASISLFTCMDPSSEATAEHVKELNSNTNNINRDITGMEKIIKDKLENENINYDQMINGEVGFGLNEEANISKALGLRYKSKLEGKSKSEQMQAFLSQSRGLF